MEGFSFFPLEIEQKIILHALFIVPIDLEWNRRVIEEWGLVVSPKHLVMPVLPQIPKVRLSGHQKLMLETSWSCILLGIPSLLIESYTRAGKSTLMNYLLYSLYYTFTEDTRIIYISCNLRLSHLARDRFLDILENGTGEKAQIPKNIVFEPKSSTHLRGHSANILLYDCDSVFPAPDMILSQMCNATQITTYSRWTSPHEHLGIDKMLDMYPSFILEYTEMRALYSVVLSLPQKGHCNLTKN
jgi:hypothetical protein